MEDRDFRHAIYSNFATAGRAPTRDQLAIWAGGRGPAQSALERLHDAHALVLDAERNIRMALPFSDAPTDYKVTAGNQSWWANCAWDSLAIPAALGNDAAIDANWMESGEPVELAIVAGELSHTNGFIHFLIPARHWWDDIVET